jgi:predicted DNA-binding transcriptional regulator AlpA
LYGLCLCGDAVDLAELRDRIRQRADDAAKMGASAPVASTLALVLAELEGVQDGSIEAREPDRLLGVAEVASAMQVPESWLYRHWKTLPFARKLGRRTLRFSQAGLRKYLERRRAA